MAELALSAASPLVEMVVNKLASGLWKELGLMRSAYTDFEKLKSELSRIKAVLDDAERRSISDKAVSDWLKKLRDAAFDADDVVDELQTEALRQRTVRHDHTTGKVRDFFSSNNPIVFRYKIARKIKKIRERLDEIAQERFRYHLAEGSVSEKIIDRQTLPSVIESEIYGRDDDKKEVTEFLIHKDNDKNISILPIVGLGGVGKTTLAQLVYNDEKIKEKFELRMWVCVGENFDLKIVMQKMIEQVTVEQRVFSSLEAKSSFLQEKLNAKRFLLVLDDLWNQEESEWEKLKPLFKDARLGSKIIVTTRSEIVTSITGTVSPYKLQGLGNDDCWILFKQRAFRFEREEDNPELEKIGREIIKKCGGLPLAAKALGSLMSSNVGVAAWSAICRDIEIGRLPIGEAGILRVLKLSYDHLPSHLKQCFTYCSMFPKDHKFEMARLIQLWMAEGLLDTWGASQNVEDIGKQYFNSLLWRSFFQDVQMDKYNNVHTCKMHDLVHDLGCSLTKDESLVMEMGRKNIPHGCRYLSFVCENESSITLETIYEAKKLRSLVLLGQTYLYQTADFDKFVINVTRTFTRLRALDLSRSRIQKLSDRLSRLKHLRFLDLSRTQITTLPTSITRLHNLQTLNLEDCYLLKELPEGITNLRNLRNLDISGCDNLSCTPHHLGLLSSLETLPIFIVAQENGRTIAELQHLNSISGRLVIKNLHHVNDPNEAMQANLKAKMRLNYLKLEWNEGLDEAPEPSSTEVAGDVFERLQPHHNLRELDIKGFAGTRLPNWMASVELVSSSFPYLVELTMWTLKRCEHLPPLGQLPLLKVLTMCGMHAVKRIREEFYGDSGWSAFPSLEELHLFDMPNLEEWHTEPTVLGRKMATFPHLTKLSIKSCPKLMVQPCIPCSIVELTIESSNEMLLSAGNLAVLSQPKKLEIWSCGALLSGWDGLQYLNTLEVLQICDCHELACLPEGTMDLPSLHTLYLWGNNNLRILDRGGRMQQQQHAPFFVALQQLSIRGCPNLAMLPDGLQHLTAFQQLDIMNCPQLARRCKRETGEDWHKIARIPRIKIWPEEEDNYHSD